ncbi:uncharacterized protein Osi17 [Tribolium castaneum]|uniref:Uncharacterized protein n=1 Tax=Tribolium castaneum TaxID=7070 RepID=D6X0W5_TRICA|nr:PREDICTED: uncharacterized protein LOC103312129 [Tribolium castaneum]EFA10563.1 hypothetical protein TcasGA2_TC012819 [Tribolium castaneum]|eukprot:XP_008198463.1 PREDICTED: uncharacterized protein LOC103312129 [Tribolium castaneum]
MLILLLVPLLTGASATSNVTIDEIPETYLNLSAGNSLWTALLKNCRQPTMACVEKTVYEYLKRTVETREDLHVVPFVKMKRNQVDYDRISGPEIGDWDEEEPESSLEAMSRDLHGKSVKFLMTHDMEVQLPETMFQGSVLKISPRAFEGNGALVKLEIQPKEVQGIAEGRLFKKLKNFISEKLIYALLAILLVIKLLAAKFMFFMPMAVGAVTAKKLLIKVLLFLFPALHHFFKLCAYVPHGTKYHHHKHHISHIHHVAPHKHHHHGHHHPHPHDSVEVIHPHAEGPPVVEGPWHHGGASLHHSIEIEEPHKTYYKPHEQELEYYSGGPHLSHHFINHRQDSQEDNEVQPAQGHRNKKPSNRPLTPSEIEAMVLKAEKEAKLKVRLQQERHRIQEENARLQEQLKLALKIQEKLKQQAAVVKAKLPVPPSTNLQTPASEQKQVYSAKVKQPEVVQPETKKEPTPFETALHQAAAITYDPFYSPILEKIDKILVGLGFNEEPCRERLICSMYKNPVKFSPHSNLLSAELSRDSKELQKPTTTNAAVIRFYRYVQAARDGQDKRECLRLYPSCSINTEQ